MLTRSIAQLTASQAIVVDLIARIEDALRSPYSLVKPNIRKIQNGLFSHFGAQDEKFFKELASCYQLDRESVKVIEFLTHDLNELKIKFLIFFDKYTGELADRGSSSFPRDFTQFSAQVLARFKTEEEYLFPLIKKSSLESCTAKG